MFWLKLHAFFSSVGNVLLPFIKLFLKGAGPIILDIAQQVVLQLAKSDLSSSDKREEAFNMISLKVSNAGIDAATRGVTTMINGAIEIAVAKMKDDQTLTGSAR